MKAYLLATTFFFCIFTLHAQEEPLLPGRTVIINLQGSVQYVGEYQGERDGYIILERKEEGEIQIAQGMIRSMEVVPPSRFFNGEYWREPMGAFQNLLTPTAFPLKPGEVHYKNISLYFNQVSVGLNDRLSVGLFFQGIDAFAVFSPIVGITPKVALTPPDGPAHLAAGGMVLMFPDEDEILIDAALAYGILTFGTPDRNFSFGLGYGYEGRRWSTRPAYTFSANYRTGKKLALLAEGWALPQLEATLGTLGLKIIGRRSDWSFSFPAGVLDGERFFLPLPIISFSTVLHRY